VNPDLSFDVLLDIRELACREQPKAANQTFARENARLRDIADRTLEKGVAEVVRRDEMIRQQNEALKEANAEIARLKAENDSLRATDAEALRDENARLRHRLRRFEDDPLGFVPPGSKITIETPK
jgi:hypothetical protein